jgi:hypothetical protein
VRISLATAGNPSPTGGFQNAAKCVRTGSWARNEGSGTVLIAVEMGEEAEHWLAWIRVIKDIQPEKAESSWPQSGDGRNYRFNVNGYQEVLYSGANR